MRLSYCFIFLGLGAIITSVNITMADELLYESIESYNGWRVYRDEVACWISADASYVKHDDLRLPNPIMNVSFFLGNHNPEISFLIPGCCDVDVSAHTESFVMPLTVYQDTHFSQRLGELDFLVNLLKGDYVDIREDESNERIMAFSLSGFRGAYSEVSRICEFRSLNLGSGRNAQTG